MDRTIGKSQKRNNDGERLMKILRSYKDMMKEFINEADDVMDKTITDKDGNEIKVKTAYDDPKHDMHDKAVQMVKKDRGDDDSGSEKDDAEKLSGKSDFSRDGGDEEPSGDAPKDKIDHDDPEGNGEKANDLITKAVEDRGGISSIDNRQSMFDDIEHQSDFDTWEEFEEHVRDVVAQHTEEPSGDEPSGEEPGDGSDKDPKVQAAHKTAADIQGDDSIYRHTDRRRYALEKMTKKEAEETQETLSAESQRSEEKGTNEFKGKTPITSDDVPEGKYHSGDPYDEFVWDSEKDREDFLEAKAAASSWYTMTHPSEGGSYGRPIDIKWKEGEQEESITINGKKYRSIKESKKPNKRVLKENYDRIFRSRK